MKKKTIFLGALIASASLMFLSSCVHKPANKTTNTGTTPVTTDTTPVTNTGVKPTTDTSVTPTTVVEDVIVENALFNNSILRVKVANKKIKSIEQFGYDYTAYLPVYDSNNKISYFKVFSTNNSFISSNHVGSFFYELDTDNLLGNLIFHVDTNGNLVIIENKKDYNYNTGGVNIDYTKYGCINKVTVSKDGKITKDLSTTDGAYSYLVSDDSIKFEGRNTSGKESKVEYTINDIFDLNLSVTEGSKTLTDLTLSVYDGNINMSYYALYSSSSGDYTFSFENNKLVGTKKVYDGTTTEIEYMYDESNRLSTIHRKGASDVLSIEHNEVGKISKETYGSSIDQYIFDNEYRVGKKDPTSPYGNLNYISSYNENFQTLVRMENGGHGKQSYEFTYDEKGRETSYRNYYYTSPTSDERFLAYENLYTIGTNGELTCDIYYRYDSTGKVLEGTKTEYSTNGNKEIEKYYRVADVKDVWNLQRETTTEELENGVVTETTNYSNNLKTSYTRNSKIFDELGYQTTTTTIITYNESGEVTKTTEYVDGVYDAENNIYLKTTSEDGKVISKNYTAYADSNQNVALWRTYEEYDSNEELALSRHTTYETLDDGKLTRVEEKTYVNGLVSTYKDTKKEPDGTVYYEETIVYEYNLDNRIDTETITLSKKNVSGSMVETNKYVVHSYNYVSGSFHEYIWNYNVASDETKTHSYDLSIFYDSEGKIWKQLRFSYSGDTIIEDPSQTEYYKYNEDGTLSQYEIIKGASDVINDYIYEDGKLVKITSKRSESGNIIAETVVDDFGQVETNSSSYIDSNDEEVINIVKKYTINLFGELVLYKVIDYSESSNVEIIAGTKVITSRRGVETVFVYDIYTGDSYMEEQISKSTAYTYNDGEKDIIGYYLETDRHYFEDMTLKSNDRKKYTLDGVLMSTTISSTVRTDIDTITSTTINYAEDGETPTMTEIGVVEYEYGTNNQISSKMTRIDHTKNDETTHYVWNFTTGEWELVEE